MMNETAQQRPMDEFKNVSRERLRRKVTSALHTWAEARACQIQGSKWHWVASHLTSAHVQFGAKNVCCTGHGRTPHCQYMPG